MDSLFLGIFHAFPGSIQREKRSDGLTWNCTIDFMEDGTHPTDAARLKVANMLFDFFKNSETTKTWLAKNR